MQQERVILRIRPAVAAVFARPWQSLTVLLVLSIVVWWAMGPGGWVAGGLGWMGFERMLAWPVVVVPLWIAFFLRLVWSALWWICSAYTLTERRLVHESGVLTRVRSEIELSRVQTLLEVRTPVERLAGIGTLGAASASAIGPEVVWEMIDRPGDRLSIIRRAMDEAKQASGSGTMKRGEGSAASAMQITRPTNRPIVVGLIGGIGSGKSAAAAMLAEERDVAGRTIRGVVVDSDREARAALEKPEVKAELVRWWGMGVLKDGVADGPIDRAKVAEIVFKQDDQRRRLEALIHPLVKKSRAELIERAAGAGARLVIVDAPLLLEAGVDAECDAVVFVDAAKAQRVARVASRGWDEAELERREAAQWSLERKKERSDYVLPNDGTLEDLRAQAAQVVRQILAPAAARDEGGASRGPQGNSEAGEQDAGV